MRTVALACAALLGAGPSPLAAPTGASADTREAAPAGVVVSPQAVYLSSRAPSTAIQLYNSDRTPMEVELALAFGYPVSDSLGRLDVPLTDRPAHNEPSALGWLRIYPQRLVLEPGQRQTVRIAAAPPALPTGEYWARLLVRSTPSAGAIGGAAARERPAMVLVTELNTSIAYRQGAVTTGVEVSRAAPARTDSTATLTLDLERTGNAAYVGRLEVEVRAADGELIDRREESLAVYRRLRRVVSVQVPADRHTAPLDIRYRLATERDDVPSESLIRGEVREGRVAVASP